MIEGETDKGERGGGQRRDIAGEDRGGDRERRTDRGRSKKGVTENVGERQRGGRGEVGDREEQRRNRGGENREKRSDKEENIQRE